MADDGVRQATAVNPGDKFELVFKGLLKNLFAERMDQNEDIFVRFMNDEAFQNVVTSWMSSEAYRRLRSDDGGITESQATGALPPNLRLVDPPADQRYVTCLPLVPLNPTSPTRRGFCRFSFFSAAQVIELLESGARNRPRSCL